MKVVHVLPSKVYNSQADGRPARSEEAEKPDKDEKAPVTPEQALGGALVHCTSQW